MTPIPWKVIGVYPIVCALDPGFSKFLTALGPGLSEDDCLTKIYEYFLPTGVPIPDTWDEKAYGCLYAEVFRQLWMSLPMKDPK